MKMIVGLGNPGKEYENTRHNAGFRFIDQYINENKIKLTKEKFGGEYEIINQNDEKIIILKPQKYINLSGEVIKSFIDYYKIPIENILVIHDDLDTEIGHLKVKYKGSSGGHNGLKNIEKYLNTKEYKRVKIGISRNKDKDKIDYVIGQISKKELEKINSVNKYATELINDFLKMNLRLIYKMQEANAIFKLDGVNLTIQCTQNDVMKDICQRYANIIQRNIK